jgi:hypothetical protein
MNLSRHYLAIFQGGIFVLKTKLKRFIALLTAFVLALSLMSFSPIMNASTETSQSNLHQSMPNMGALEMSVATPAALAIDLLPFAEAPLEGSGTEADPYLLTTRENMLWLANLPDTAGLHFMLNQAEGTAIEVDFIIPTFNGTFDGNGRTINLDIVTYRVENVGLFGMIQPNGSIRNLHVYGTILSVDPANSQLRAGGLAGVSVGRVVSVGTDVTITITASMGESGILYIGGLLVLVMD